jgi:hypothetical protein
VLVLAEAPVHSLPWYFGVVVFGAWAAAAAGFTLLVRRRLRAQAQRRRDRRDRQSRRRPTTPPGPVRDDRSLGSGDDLERL